MRLASVFVLSSTVVMVTGCQPPAKNDSAPESAYGDDAHKFIPGAPAIEHYDDPIEVKAGSGDTIVKSESSDFDNGEVNVNDLYGDCGVKKIPDVEDNVNTFATKLQYEYYRVINAGFGKAVVPLRAILDLKNTFFRSGLNVGVEVLDNIAGEYRGSDVDVSEPDLIDIQGRAEELANNFRGLAENKIWKPGTHLMQGPWERPFCTVFKAYKIVNNRGPQVDNRREVVSTYDPPFPPNISPLASKERYEIELEEVRHFSNIKVTITDAVNSIFKPNQTLIGSVLVEKIPNETEVEIARYDINNKDPNSDYLRIKRKIKSDVAYRITNRFGTEEQTLALGLHLWTEYYVDTVNKNFTAVVANVGDEDIMYFFREDQKPIKIGD